ncbi:lytic murein transglycosylase [Telmatospirillum sp.]|uniref:lytic murein transglycosylase n=1 Tax=Telmatospirillum sp. TaxID=2079197 RepID=UPI0028412AF7|nr:lytic murein transglycosylase [Telmatospirillum sp.]MDR3435461.1 lytic murein transglycosylase [Telmatospirillum sp.]
MTIRYCHAVSSALAILVGGVFVLCLMATTAMAQSQPDFAEWLNQFRRDAQAQGISDATIAAALTDIAPIDKVVELDRRQPEFTLTFEAYLSHVVKPERVAEGLDLLKQNETLLADVAKRYGVPPEVIVAMWGVESNFGHLTGGFQVVPALATLAYDGRRSQYFRTELIDALKIIDQGIPANRMQGSWAGAMGQCQFMPSTYLKFARKWNGEGAPDIWQERADIFASTAHYLSQIGWHGGQSWGQAVQLPEHGMAPQLIGLDVKHSLKEWGKLGVRSADGKPLPVSSGIRASLILAENAKSEDAGHGVPYLVYDNFRVLMRWNKSVFFALGAGTLADRLGSK